MKKKFCFVLISLFFIVNFVQAKKVPDPLYLNSEVMDMDVEAQKKLEKEQKKQEKKEKKIQKKREKLKAKNRIPKRYEYIDKSETPITNFQKKNYGRIMKFHLHNLKKIKILYIRSHNLG